MYVPILLSLAAAAAAQPLVNTTKGQVAGMVSPYRSGVNVFKNIPYGQTTAGSNRWKPPVAAEAWDGVLNATEFGPQCAQSNGTWGIFSSGSGRISEDCLSVNVWAPANATSTSQLPVYVWIYGGRFEAGSGDVPTYDGTGLAVQDIVVVTLNYRVGAFGFLAHPDLSAESAHNASGNYGLMDQQLALHWVQDEIANFGGDPEKVTVGGQSAGSASALQVMYSPLAKGLARAVIAESGARGPHDPMTGSLATSYRTKEAALEDGVAFLETMDVTSIDELRNVSMDALIAQGSTSDTTFDNTVYAELSSAFMNPPLWRPNLDGYVFPYSYGDSLLLNTHNDIAVMTGNNKDESGASEDQGYTVASYTSDFTEMFGNLSSTFFSLYPAGSNDSVADASSNDFFRDLSRVSTWTWAKDWYAGGAESKVYTYYWTHAAPDEDAAYHGSELWYTFNNIPYASSWETVNYTSTDYAIEATMTKYWANFIKNVDPNGDGLTYWPATTSNVSETMWLGDSWGSSYLSNSTEREEFILSWLSTLPSY